MPALPPELLNNDPHGFAWGVWRERTPKLVAEIRDGHPYEPAQRRALDGLLEEIAFGAIEPLPPSAHDARAWDAWGTGYFGTPWLEAPFLWSESYFYRRLLEAVGFFGPGAWRWVDPFDHLKAAELADPALVRDLAALDELRRLPVAEQGQAKLLASLWGNRADLVFQLGTTGAIPAGSAGLLADDSAEFWSSLGPAAPVAIVTDNAGRELLADLVLVEHLLRHSHAASVTLHTKPHPYYVSDATATDVLACLRRLAGAGGSASEIAHLLRGALADGRLSLRTSEFHCAPWSYHRMPADLAAEFAAASLTIFKGDLNYRRLAGDRDWPPTTPFADVSAYFPGRVAALRTLKSDVAAGIAEETVAALDSTGQPWRTDGSHAVVQVRLS